MSMLFLLCMILHFKQNYLLVTHILCPKVIKLYMGQTLKLVKLKKSMQIITGDLYSFLAEYPL